MPRPSAHGAGGRRLGALLAATMLVGCSWSGSPFEGSDPRAEEDGADQVARWMGRLGSAYYPQVERARFELQALGREAVPALRDAVERGGPASAEAVATLLDMGPAAEDALPLLLTIAADPEDQDPPGWPSRMSRRKVVLENARLAGWADEAWVEVLDRVWQDPAEPLDLRRLAVESLIGLGLRGANSLVRVLTEGPLPLRSVASHALRGWLGTRGLETEADFHAWLLRADPLGPDAPSHAAVVRSGGATAEALSTCREAKAALTGELEAHGAPEVALRLASILQDELIGDWLAALVPDTVRIQGELRFDREEDLSRLEWAIATGLEQAPPGSLFGEALGLGLARVRLLRGDWAGMNEVLAALGRETVPPEDRPWMTAPPRSWSDPAHPWRRAPAEQCGGPCTLTVEVQYEGRGFQGAHVVLRQVDEDTWDPGVDSGVDPRLHFLLEQAPLSLIPDRGFGLPADLVEGTRYGVTGPDGRVTLPGLLEGPWQMTLLVPTSTLSGWEGPFGLFQVAGGGEMESLSLNAPPRDLGPLMLTADDPARTLRYLVMGR